MSKIPFLFQLPSAWLVAVLSEWLDMPSIGMLDTAISSKKHRSQFLNCLQNMRSTTIDRFSDHRGEGFLDNGHGWTGCWWRWLSVRQIYVESIVLRGKEVRADLVVPSMRNVKIKYCEDEDLQYLVRNCPALRCLGIETSVVARRYQPVSEIGLEVLTNLHQSLEEFSYARHVGGRLDQDQEYQVQSAAAALIDMLRQTSNLHKVSLTGTALRSVNLEELLPYGHLFQELEFEGGCQTIAYVQHISNLLAYCSNLTKLHYMGSEDDELDDEMDSLFLTAIHQSCPLLEELELMHFLFNQQDLPAGSGVFALINRNCRHLRRLTLNRCELSASILRSIAELEALKELDLTECEGLTDAGLAALATMKLVGLSIFVFQSDDSQLSSLQSFVGSNISQTLETFDLSVEDDQALIDDVQVATALASCHNLKKLAMLSFVDGYAFGRDGLDGLQAMAVGCPLLADVSLSLTAPGLHYLGAHFPNLRKCSVSIASEEGEPAPEGFPSIEELQTLYPAVKWAYDYL
jgi:hypothetical protein